jgi:short-subunit dehydrogenase
MLSAMARPLAVVTGASSGIGREIAKLAAADGYDVLLVARRQAELETLAKELNGVDAEVCTADLSKPAGVKAVVTAVGKRDVDVLVNNAGFGGHGRFVELDETTIQRMIAVNVTSLVSLCRAFLPRMTARGSGHILNVASTAAFQPGPFMAVYYASKSFVLLLSEALDEECAGTPVSVTALCPGATATEFQATADVPAESPLFRAKGPDAAAVAAAGWHGALQGKRIVIPGAFNKFGVQALRVSPRRMVTKVVRRLHPV